MSIMNIISLVSIMTISNIIILRNRVLINCLFNIESNIAPRVYRRLVSCQAAFMTFRDRTAHASPRLLCSTVCFSRLLS